MKMRLTIRKSLGSLECEPHRKVWMVHVAIADKHDWDYSGSLRLRRDEILLLGAWLNFAERILGPGRIEIVVEGMEKLLQ